MIKKLKLLITEVVEKELVALRLVLEEECSTNNLNEKNSQELITPSDENKRKPRFWNVIAVNNEKEKTFQKAY